MTGGRLQAPARRGCGDGTFMLTYGDGVCDVDLDAAARVPPRARPARHGHRRAPAGALRRPRSSTATAVARVHARSRRSARAGSTAASSSSSPASSTTSTATRRSLEREPLERLAADGQLLAYRHDGFWQCMDTLRDVRLLESLWADRRGALEGVGVTARRVLARPARPRDRGDRAGRRRGWSGGCVEARRATSSCLVRDCGPAVASSCATRLTSTARHGRARRRRGPGAARARARRVRDRHRLPPRRADDRRHRQPQPGRRRSRRTSRGTWHAARGLPPQPARQAGRRRVVATRPTATPTALPVHRGDAAPRPAPVRREQVVRRPDRPDLRAHLRRCPSAITRCGNFYGGGDLNWNRIVPGTIRSRAARRAAGHPLATARSCATTSTSRTARPRTCCWPRRSRPTRRSSGEAFNFSNEQPRHGARARATAILDARWARDLEPDVRNEAMQRDPAPVLSAREGATSARLEARASRSTRGSRQHDRVVPRLPRRAATA